MSLSPRAAGSEGTTRLKYTIPTRALLGLRNAMLTATKGTAVLNTNLIGWVGGRAGVAHAVGGHPAHLLSAAGMQPPRHCLPSHRPRAPCSPSDARPSAVHLPAPLPASPSAGTPPTWARS